MALDLEDQEQLDEFKVWWNKSGKFTIALVLSAIVVYAAWLGYQHLQQQKAVEASDIYQSILQNESAEIDLVKDEAKKLKGDYSASPYAGRAAVLLAKSYFETDDIANAKAQLEWAREHAEESAIQAVASLQLATILLGEKDYDAAQKILASDIDQGYLGLKDNLQGDVFVAQGKIAEAKKSYENALTNLDGEGRLRLFTQQKLDSLGS